MPICTSKWYPRKAPILQIEILNAIATRGQLSKMMAKELTGSYYPDVSDAMEGLVKRQFVDFHITVFLHPKSNHKRFFQLTNDGLQAFIDGKPSPTEFWKAIYWFCKLSKEKIDWNTFDALCRRFRNIYLGYTPHHGHFFQFRFIDLLFKKWLKDNDQVFDPARDNIVKGVVISQRILECLGMNRSITLRQLCQHIEKQTPVFERGAFGREITKGPRDSGPWLGHGIDSSEEGIKRALEEFTLSKNYEIPNYWQGRDKRDVLDQIMNQYVDFIQHLVVVPRINKKRETRYELSLFGIALLLSLWAFRYYNPEMIFYNNLEFGEFCAKLSTNYQDKLPLVFGKWNGLMKETIERNNVIFEILRDLFYDRTSKAMIESSVIVRGVKEYYDGAKALSDWSYLRLEAIYHDGEKILEELGQSDDCDCDKMFSRKVEEISKSLRQRNLNRFMDDLRGDGEPNSPIRDPYRIYANELVYTEKVLADEISFLFYMFFYARDLINHDLFQRNYSAYFPEMLRTARRIRTLHMEDGVPMFKYKTEIESEGAYPLESFVNIVRNHKDIQRLLVSWIDDASKYQSDVQAKISRLKSYTQKE